MESMENQGAKMADTMQNIVTRIQAAQAQQAQFMGDWFMKLFAGMAWTKLNTRTDNEYVQETDVILHNVKVLFDKLIDERPKHILWCTLIFLFFWLFIPSDCN